MAQVQRHDSPVECPGERRCSCPEDYGDLVDEILSLTEGDMADIGPAERVALDDDLFAAHDCRQFAIGPDPENVLDDCEVCWLATK